MLRFLLLLLLPLLSTAVWPLPTASKTGTDSLTIPSFTFQQAGATPFPDNIADAIARYTAVMFTHTPSNDAAPPVTISVAITDPAAVLQLNADESYTLTASVTGLAITSPTQLGFYHALETLSQLVGFDFDTETYVLAANLLLL